MQARLEVNGQAVRHAYLDGLRGVAIAFVLLEHFWQWPLGRLGVDLFFALSGMLIAHVLFHDRVPLPVFYQRRVARIFPGFYLYLVTMFVAGAVLQRQPPWADGAYSAVFLRTYLPGTDIWQAAIPIGNLWSLNVEEHSYVGLSLVAFMAAGRGGERAARWILVAATLACVACYGYFHVFPVSAGASAASLRTECAALPLLASAGIFLWLRTLERPIGPWAATVVLISCALVAAASMMPIERGGGVLRHIVVPTMLALFVNVMHASPRIVKDLLSTRWLVWMGLCSFSIYLWHYPFFFLANHGYWSAGPVAGLVAALAVSACCYYGFEQPMRAWIRGLGGRRRSTA